MIKGIGIDLCMISLFRESWIGKGRKVRFSGAPLPRPSRRKAEGGMTAQLFLRRVLRLRRLYIKLSLL